MKITADIKIETLAEIIVGLSDRARIRLMHLLEVSEDRELINRKSEIENGQVKPIARKDVFGL